jgi:hypothetical protein
MQSVIPMPSLPGNHAATRAFMGNYLLQNLWFNNQGPSRYNDD